MPEKGAGDEQRETGHVDPAGTGSARAGTVDDGGRAHRLVWLNPRELAVHPRNIRDDLGDLSGLADSIAKLERFLRRGRGGLEVRSSG